MDNKDNTLAGDDTSKAPATGGINNDGGYTTDNKAKADAAKANAGDDKSGETKTFNQADVDKIVSERIKREQDKFEKTLTETREEEARLAKLSATEKEQELRKKENKEFEQKKLDLKLKENRLDGRLLLVENGLSEDFIEHVLVEDPTVMQERILKLKSTFQDAVNKAVTTKLAGKTPKDPTGNNSDTVATERKNYF